MNTPALLFVNLRRTAAEGRAALFAAQKLGYQTVLLTDTVPAYAKDLYSQIEIVDTYNWEQALQVVRNLSQRFELHGVVTWSDRDVELVAQIGQMLGLPAPSPTAARLARNKFEMRQALCHLPGIVPQHARVRTETELEVAIEKIGFPAILKPTGASGSKGIFEVSTKEDALAAFRSLQIIAQPTSDPVFRIYGAEFIFEEFLAGPEFSVEGWVFQGKVEVVGITDKLTTDPFHLELQHIFPSHFHGLEQQEIAEKTALVVKTLGLDNCAFHLEGKMTANGFRLIEIAARIGGDYITSHLIPLSTGIDFYAQVLRVVTGQQPQYQPTTRLYAGARFVLADTEGKLSNLDGIEKILRHPAVEHLFFEGAPGVTIQLPPRHFVSQRIATVLARHPEYAALERFLGEVPQQCTVRLVEPVTNSTI